jgi:uncharacterized protein YjeT (DUF2065 family)
MLNMITTDPVLLFVGLFMLVCGLSLMLAPAPWGALIDVIRTSEVAPAVTGMVALAFGLAIIVFYASWDGAARSVLTVFGWAALAEAAIYLFFPHMLKKIVASDLYQAAFKFGGPICIVCGLVFLLA